MARLDTLDSGRLWADLGWRAVQVFVASLLVELAAADFITVIKRVEFWQDCAISATIAVLAQVLALAAHATRTGSRSDSDGEGGG